MHIVVIGGYLIPGLIDAGHAVAANRAAFDEFRVPSSTITKGE